MENNYSINMVKNNILEEYSFYSDLFYELMAWIKTSMEDDQLSESERREWTEKYRELEVALGEMQREIQEQLDRLPNNQ